MTPADAAHLLLVMVVVLIPSFIWFYRREIKRLEDR